MKVSAKTCVPVALGAFFLSFSVTVALAQDSKEVIYRVAAGAIISISNNYGPIAVKGASARQVVVTMTSHSPAVSFQNEQHGNRIELRVISPTAGDGLAEYTVVVPVDAWVTMQSSAGMLRAENLEGDLNLQAMTGPIIVNDVRGAHLHLRSLDGPITLTGIRNSQLDVNSVSGSISLRDVRASSAVVHSGAGRISYEGDPGANGEYNLTSHTGDLEISIPATSPVEIKPRSLTGQFSEEPRGGVRSETPGFLGKSRVSSLFVLRSFHGKIHVKRP